MPQGLVPVESVALQQWRRVYFRVEVKPGMKSITDQNGPVVRVSYQKPYLFEMPDKIPTIALLPPPHCGVCNRPISKIQIICTPDGASIEASCHGYKVSQFLLIEALTAQGSNSIYREMLEAFSNKDGFNLRYGIKDFDNWKPQEDPKWREASFRSDPGMRILRDIQEQELLKQYANPRYASNSSMPPQRDRGPDCCLCRNPVKVYCRNDYQRNGHEVTFECHGRREVTFVGTEQTRFRGISLEEFISNMNPFVSDFKRLNIPEEPPKQKSKPRTGLTITIGQERAINLE